MHFYNKYYSKIFKLKTLYEKLLNEIKNISDSTEKLDAILFFIRLFIKYNSGYYTCSYIENFLTDYAHKINNDSNYVKYKPNSFLHVLTTGYNTGGHTRVIERWIQNAPINQSHSVLFTNYKEFNMKTLEQNVKNKNGNIIFLDNQLSIDEKALSLRKIGFEYQYIVLHVHMDDIIPMLAFGTEKFTRPILFYNHASHLFWIGKSISDVVLDLEKNDSVTLVNRNIKNSCFLGIPSEKLIYSKKDKYEIRKNLNLPVDKKIIITAGSEVKYRPIGNDHYGNIINKMLDENTICYIIGIDKKNKYWKKYIKNSNGHIIPLKYINFNNGFLDYIAAADLYIDSYPFCGGTAMIDAISQGVPSLSLISTYPQMDYLKETSAYCKTKDEFITKAKKIMQDKHYADSILEELQKSLELYQSTMAWNERIESIIKNIPNEHKLTDLSGQNDLNVIDDLTLFVNIMGDKNFLNKNSNVDKILNQKPKEIIKYGLIYQKIGIPYIFEFIKSKNSTYKIIRLKIFNFTVFEHRKAR